MLSDFKAKKIKDARYVIIEDLQVAKQAHEIQKEHEKELKKSLSSVEKTKVFLSNIVKHFFYKA